MNTARLYCAGSIRQDWWVVLDDARAPSRSAVLAAALLSVYVMDAMPARAQRLSPPPGSPLPGIQRATPPPVAPAMPVPQEAVPPRETAAQSFPIVDVTIIGNTAYGPDAFAATIGGLTGPAVPLQRIENARAAILSRYREDGYTYTTVRARLHEGHLRITITEPRVVAVTLSQDIGSAGVQVLRFLNHLADGRLLRASDLERYVLLANDVPGVTVRALLDPSATDPGALTLRAGVERKPFSGSVTADNRAFNEIGPDELLTVADANSFTSFGERSEVSLYHTFDNTNNFGQASEEFFIGGSGLKLKLYGGDGESLPSGQLYSLGYDGITRVFGAALSYPVIRARQENLAVALQFDGIESDIAYHILQGPNARTSFDSLRIMRLDAQGSLSDIWLGANFGGQTQAEVTLSQGLPIFGALSEGNPDAPRLNERVDFAKVSARLDRIQALFVPFTVGGVPALVQLDLAVTGQYSPDVLPPEEKFYLGGPQFTRGFYYGEVTGDRALAARLEPQLVTALPKLPWTAIVPQATLYAFIDWGETWEQQSSDLNHTLRSIGGGVRMQAGDHLEIDLEGLSRLTRTPNGAPPLGPVLRSSALYWQVVGRF
jgi:hemolysin activation/secretion protein